MIQEGKRELRKFIRSRKATFAEVEKAQQSKSVFEKLERLNIFGQAKTIVAYWSLKDEVDTIKFIEKWHKQKTILLPVIDGNDLILKTYQGQSSMQAYNSFGIPEPIGKPFTEYDSIDIMIVPGMAFDKDGNRLGRGKGFYDRLLKSVHAVTIGICFDFQFVEKVPTEKHDIPMQIILHPSD